MRNCRPTFLLLVLMLLAACTSRPAYMKGVETLPPQSRATLDAGFGTARAAVLSTLTQNGYAIVRTQEVDQQTIVEGTRSIQEGKRITEVKLSVLLTRVGSRTSLAITARETVNDVVRSWLSFPALLKLFLPYSTTESGTYLVRDSMIDDPRFYEKLLSQVERSAEDLVHPEAE